MPYWGIYLKSLSFNALQIGALLSLFQISRIFAPNVLGWVADQSGEYIKWIKISSFFGFIIFMGIFWSNTFVNISLDYSLKGESEVVFISEAGYISHKQSIGNISKNEKYNIDISKIPAGKYLVTIVNGKTYTTPQKLIVL